MIFDMNDVTAQGENAAYPDWPYAPPVRAPLREQVIIRGSSSAGNVTHAGAAPDAPEAPRG